MTSKSCYIPPSDDDSSSVEFFENFLKPNKIQQITTAQYQAESPNLVYSELAPFQPSTSRGKFILVISLSKHKFLTRIQLLNKYLHLFLLKRT